MSLPKTPSNSPESQGFSNLEFTTNNYSIKDDSDSEDLAESIDTSDRRERGQRNGLLMSKVPIPNPHPIPNPQFLEPITTQVFPY